MTAKPAVRHMPPRPTPTLGIDAVTFGLSALILLIGVRSRAAGAAAFVRALRPGTRARAFGVAQSGL